MDKTNKFLSDLVIFSKYANVVKGENRKQSWNECVTKLEDMYKTDFPQLSQEIGENFKLVHDKKVFPSMRSLQMSGLPISMNNVRMYNCSYVPADDIKMFSEFLFILLSGTGAGASVQQRHIDKLPVVGIPNGRKRFLISDSIEGWADSIRMLMYAYFRGNPYPDFDFRDIRPAGSIIKKLNCVAPGSKKLESSLKEIDKIMKSAVGRKLVPIECLDILCHLSECVVSGGIRTSAVIIGFDKWEKSIMYCKHPVKLLDANVIFENEKSWEIEITPLNPKELYGESTKIITLDKSTCSYDYDIIFNEGVCPWYYVHPQRAMSNNSVVLHRDNTTKDEFLDIMNIAHESKAGDPGIVWTNDYNIFTNPCLSKRMFLQTKDYGLINIKEAYKLLGGTKYDKDKPYNDYEKMSIINSNGVVESTVPFLTSEMNNLYRVVFSNGSEIETTPNHNFKIIDENNKKIAKKLVDVRLNDKIPIPTNYSTLDDNLFSSNDATDTDYNIISLSALVSANGVVIDEPSRKKYSFKIFNSEEAVVIEDRLKLLNNDGIISSYEKENTNDSLVKFSFYTEDEGDNVFFTSEFINNIGVATNSSKRGYRCFLSHYIGSNGKVFISDKKASISCWDENKAPLLEIQMMLGLFGVYSTILLNNGDQKVISKMIKDNNIVDHVGGYKLTINGKENCRKLNDKIGLFYSSKTNKVSSLLDKMEDDNFKNPYYVKVVSIDYIGKEETYCLNEPQNNEIIVNGIITGNCGEISLLPNQFCNLSTINAYDVTTQEELNKRVTAATFIGTLQASYTNFHYLRPIWKEQTEKDSLIAVSMTGVASGNVLSLDRVQAAMEVLKENKRVAKIIGINPAKRTTTIKPEGTTTLVAGVFGAGVHAAHNEYYIRNIRVRKSDPLYEYITLFFQDFIEQDYADSDRIVLSIPMKADKDCIFRHESALDLLNRIKTLNDTWILPGHEEGVNTNNVSSTVSIKDEEADDVFEWMWENKTSYSGITILPYFGGTYKQAPYIDITKEEYEELYAKFPENLDLSKIYVSELGQMTHESACSGGSCDLKVI